MKKLLIISISIFMLSCNNGNSKKETTMTDADKMIAEAMEKAAKLQAEAEVNAKALMNEAENNALNKIEEEKEKKHKEAATKEEAELQKASLLLKTDKSLSKYNGFYVNDEHSGLGALIFVDGKLAYFDYSDFKNTYKNEEYIIKGITEDGLFDIKGKYFKDRNGKVYVKEMILREGKPEMLNGVCVSIDRLRNVFKRYATFKELMTSKRNWNYPLENLIADVKTKYNRSDAEIDKALNRTDFYKCKAYQAAEFYGERFPCTSVLESIILMN